MKGSIEIYSIIGDSLELIAKEDNLIVDGAGKTVVDVLTTFDSCSSIPSASSLLDTSNYTIQAITFGAASGSYHKNLHSTQYPLLVSGLSNTRYTVIQPDQAITYFSGSIDQPKAPSPFDTKLELFASPSGTWNNINVSLPYTTSAGVVIEDLGHHLNIAAIPSLYDQFGVSAPIAVLLGSYAPSDTTNSAVLISSINQLDPNTGIPSSFAASTPLGATATYNGRVFNGSPVIDKDGFIKMISSSANHNINFTSTDGSGLQLSASADWSSTGELVFGTRIPQKDCLVLDFYGGITTMGLWTIDVNKSISSGNTPPYSFAQLNNPRKHRLFCKKVFTKNLVFGTSLTHVRLQIVWRIKFL
jgi:hypothetical protein